MCVDKSRVRTLSQPSADEWQWPSTVVTALTIPVAMPRLLRRGGVRLHGWRLAQQPTSGAICTLRITGRRTGFDYFDASVATLYSPSSTTTVHAIESMLDIPLLDEDTSPRAAKSDDSGVIVRAIMRTTAGVEQATLVYGLSLDWSGIAPEVCH